MELMVYAVFVSSFLALMGYVNQSLSTKIRRSVEWTVQR